MLLAHKIQLDPTVVQTRELLKACGCARFTWNWALAEWEKHYKETGKSPNVFELKKRWNAEKPEWVYESPKDANQAVFGNLQKAYAAFFRKTSRKPKFKSRHKSKNSFHISNDKMSVGGQSVRLPKIGSVRMTEALRFEGRVMSAVVSERAGRWYISILVDVATQPKHGEEVLGIDLGLKTFATLSTGETLIAPEPLKKKLKFLRKRARQFSKKVKGSKNSKKAGKRLARLHARISDTRQDWMNKTTTSLVARTKLLVIENLSLSGMNKLWGRKMADIPLWEFRRQLTYKCEKSGCALIVADRFYPSTQLCSCCGGRQKLGLAERKYACPDCGFTADRDHNAAINLSTVGLSGNNACGHAGSGYSHTWAVKPAWMKQELNRVHTCVHN
jgi:putative transposase